MWLVALAAVAIVIISELTGFYWIHSTLDRSPMTMS
jgi:hypothetical protein